ncbi:hypothetical protein [Sphingobacterium sp. E70]|uniref:hypothetical protein n=1 Tax=Sphingobacterium sp. E70 TaxID=2853439 RepID=UPI00359CA2FD
MNRETTDNDKFSAYRRYFLSNSIDYLFAGGEQEKNNDGTAWKRARLNYFGRFGYNYKSKYIAEFLWRYDGSYMFPESERFGFFLVQWLVGWYRKRISGRKISQSSTILKFVPLMGKWGMTIFIGKINCKNINTFLPIHLEPMLWMTS